MAPVLHGPRPTLAPHAPSKAKIPHCRTPPLANNDSTHAGPECPSPPRCSGGSIAGADCLQSVSGNSRVLDTLGLKSQVVAYDQSSHLLRAVEQLESRARQPLPVHPNVQLEAVPGSTVTSTSIPGACCTPPHSPAIPSHPPPRRSQMAAVDRPVDDNAILIPWWPRTVEIFGVRVN